MVEEGFPESEIIHRVTMKVNAATGAGGAKEGAADVIEEMTADGNEVGRMI